METYLFKFSACLLVFWLVYVPFLERQNMHRFKRFYLLGAVVAALIIPLLTITHYIEPVVTDFEVSSLLTPMETSFAEIPQEQVQFWDLETVIWLIYGLGFLLFFTRFVINLSKMYQRITENETATKRPFIYVLLHECHIPHSFFKYIFFNKSSYEASDVPKEVMLHEEAHANQFHSLDIIVMEFLQIVFWFHPLIYILKHHVKLNHEFLADQEVLKLGADTKTYQKILLQFSSNTEEYQLTSAINYSSIKKRFTVMKTQTSKTRIWLSSLLLLPIIAILFYSFSTKEYLEKPITEAYEVLPFENQTGPSFEDNQDQYNPSFLEYIIEMEKDGATFYLDDEKISTNEAKSVAKNNIGNRIEMITHVDMDGNYLVKLSSTVKNNIYARSINLKILNDNFYSIDGIRATKETFTDVFNQLHQDITPEVRKKIMNIHVSSSKEISNKEVWFIYNSLLDYGFYRIVTANQEINRAKGNKPFAIENNFSTQQKATEKQVTAYNAWAKKLNTAISKAQDNSKFEGYPIVKRTEVEKYKLIYNIMSADQKKTSETFPQLPPPPPPPPPPAPTAPPAPQQKSGPIEINGATYYFTQQNGKTTYYDSYGKVVDIYKIPPPPPIQNDATPEQKAKMQNATDAYKKAQLKNTTMPDEMTGHTEINGEKFYYASKNGKTTYFNSNGKEIKMDNLPPPPPTKNPSFLEFITDMEKQGASFYLDDKKITAEQAKTIAKNNKGKNTEMVTQLDENGKYVVKLSEKL